MSGSSPRQRRVGRAATAGVAAALAIGLVVPGVASSHIADSTAGLTHDLYTPPSAARCLYGPGNCSYHSFTFVSANDTANTNAVCAEFYDATDHSRVIKTVCDFDFVRNCLGTAGTHPPGGAEHCNDQDGASYHVGAANLNASLGTTVTRHAVY